MKLYLNDLGLLCALGNDKKTVLSRLLAGDRSGLVYCDEFTPQRPLYFGRVKASLESLPEAFSAYDCRNNRLLLTAALQIQDTIFMMLDRFGPDRIGIVLGTSTAGIRNSEYAITDKLCTSVFHYKQQQIGAGADFLAAYFGVRGPVYTLSTACSSSGKAFMSAQRLIHLNLCDGVIVGGADSLCALTVNGFSALESVSSGLCKPFGRHRDGINIGEAATLFMLSREPAAVGLSGVGASSDAYHFSAPNPSGTAVITAMKQALAQAGLEPKQVDYLNLHGTATPLNDAMESRAVHALFGSNIAVSSSKGMTGHTLGASSALELAFCWLLFHSKNRLGPLIPNINDDEMDENLPILNWVKQGQVFGKPLQVCQSNSFAFGGSNVSLIISRTSY